MFFFNKKNQSDSLPKDPKIEAMAEKAGLSYALYICRPYCNKCPLYIRAVILFSSRYENLLEIKGSQAVFRDGHKENFSCEEFSQDRVVYFETPLEKTNQGKLEREVKDFFTRLSETGWSNSEGSSLVAEAEELAKGNGFFLKRIIDEPCHPYQWFERLKIWVLATAPLDKVEKCVLENTSRQYKPYGSLNDDDVIFCAFTVKEIIDCLKEME